MTINYYTYKDEYGRMHTVATTHYAGKKVRATTQCSIDDTYDEEKGRTLAALRLERKCCNIKLKLIENYRAEMAAIAHDVAAREAKAESELAELKEYLYFLDEQEGKIIE